jgi:hypothetical protein
LNWSTEAPREPGDKDPEVAPVRERDLRYRIEVEMLPRSGILRVADEYLAALNSKGEPTGKREPFLSRKEDRLHLRLERQAHPTYLDRYLDHSILSRPHYAPHYLHMVAARMELGSWLFFHFEPRERMRASNPVKEVCHIGLMGEALPAYLNTLRALEPRRFTAVEKALRAILPQIDGIDVSANDLGEVELRLREGGIPVPARVLWEGTLRILGMPALTGAKEPPSLVGFEEPENGIHPRRIQMIAELLKTRSGTGSTQYIVTTHSPILPDQWRRLLTERQLATLAVLIASIRVVTGHLPAAAREEARLRRGAAPTGWHRCSASAGRSEAKPRWSLPPAAARKGVDARGLVGPGPEVGYPRVKTCRVYGVQVLTCAMV